jgi:hypothetical protein
MQNLGVSQSDIDAYLASRPPLTARNTLEAIITEKYIANFLKVEPWNDWRRTGYPVLEVVEGSMLPGIPRRIRTPGAELSSNAVDVRATGIDTGLEGMSVKVWWAGQGVPCVLRRRAVHDGRSAEQHVQLAHFPGFMRESGDHGFRRLGAGLRSARHRWERRGEPDAPHGRCIRLDGDV